MMKTVVAKQFCGNHDILFKYSFINRKFKRTGFFLVTLLSFFNIAFDQEVSLENKGINFF